MPNRFPFNVPGLLFILALLFSLVARAEVEDEILQALSTEQPYHTVTAEQFARLGWDLPDGGATVMALADAAPGFAFDPRDVAKQSAEKLGYKASWHVIRYPVYGMDWDITGLYLQPNNPLPDMPTMVIVHGGSSNWYEFFVDPLNRPGIGQYLAQKIPVLLVTIPGNFRYGGWSSSQDYGKRLPGYLLDRDITGDELKVRNAIFTFRVVTDGVKKIVQEVTKGPFVVIGHSTGGEIQYILHDDPELQSRMLGLSIGWGTGGPAGMDVMKQFRGNRTAADYLDVWEIRGRPTEGYTGGYLGPLNPVWDPNKSRLEVAEHWQGLERNRRPIFKQPLQDIEHNSADNLLDHISSQIRQVIGETGLDVNSDEVIADLFSTMRSSHTGYKKMIWTTAQLDDGHWNPEPAKARELLIANEFRSKNPGTPIRVLLFDVPMTHYGHIEKPKELSGGLLVALKWLVAK